MDTITTTAITIGKASLTGVSVHAFTPLMFIILIMVIAIAVVVYKFGPKLFPKRESNFITAIEFIRIQDDIRSRKVYELETSILREQMAHGELVLDTVKTKIIELYRKQADKFHIDPQRLRDEMDVYCAFIEVQHNKALAWLRIRLKQNHLAEKSDQEFEEYSKEVTNKLISDTRMNMSSYWNKFFSVPLCDNKQSIEDMSVEFFTDIKSAFYEARKITQHKRKEISSVNSDYEKEIKKICDKVKRGEI